MKRSNQILWSLATLTLIAARDVVPCCAGEPSEPKAPPATAKQPDNRPSVDLRPILQSKLPALLHMQAVRLVGADRSSEALATYLWHRVLESIQARRKT